MFGKAASTGHPQATWEAYTGSCFAPGALLTSPNKSHLKSCVKDKHVAPNSASPHLACNLV